MKLERIVHKISNVAKTAALGSLLGLTTLNMGAMPVYGQQDVKYVKKPSVKYIHCTASENNEDIGIPLAIGGVFMRAQNNPDAQKLGDVLLTAGIMEHQKETAREGRSNVNINVNQGSEQDGAYAPAPGCVWANPEDPNDTNVLQRLGIGFAASEWEDNGDGYTNIKEFRGVKKIF